MEALLRSLKNSSGQASTAYYIYIVVTALFSAIAMFMVFLYIKLGSLQQLQQRFPNVPFERILYVITGAIGVMILVMLFNSQFEIYFQRRDDGGINRPLPPFQTFWDPAKTPNPQDPINLQLVSDDFPMTRADVFTMGVQLFVGDSRSTDKMGPYRHILHRGTGELMSFLPNSPGSIPKGRADLNDGLPLQMNPGLFLDQYTNDLLVYVDTDPASGGQAYRESVRINDIPLKKPFYVYVVVHDQILEVYINCRLAVSKFLNGIPRDRKSVV